MLKLGMNVALEDVNAYVADGRRQEHGESLEIGTRIAYLLKDQHRIDHMLLLDNVIHFSDAAQNIPNQTGGSGRYNILEYYLELELAERGFPRKIIREADYLFPALYFAESLKANPPEGYRISQQGTHLIGPLKERIKIFGYPGVPTTKNGLIPPSCQVLDAAMYQGKLQSHDLAITVLDIDYETQQAQTRKILSWITGTENQPVIVVYHHKGEVVKVDGWSSEVENIRGQIASELIPH